ncbi:ABC transporter ATP-binding protein [Eubacterium sp. 1001713B170207_170306_E7]|uniref:ABC transporter ATP-binding protein n=1 Tax=Eubacterium sp. 1001713B170207_170306_E7 TaxID=2787097 RepID=UPI00189A4E34|nr:ABC transporter ATP-binding protein [Eubacterium sp. 1001713B170207_170306_E7]
MKTLLEVRDLCKTYIVNKQQNNVLRNVNLSIGEGEYTAVMGPSGSGKSTLLYTVSGMDRLTAGEITFDGRRLSSMNEEAMASLRLTEMGFIFQQMYLLKNLSIYDNIILSAYMANKRSRPEINADADVLMKQLGIIELADNDISETSGGQLQRACICRALINRPKILFADEPTGALNSRAAREVMNVLDQVNAQGTALMVVTHDPAVAARADRVLYIRDGNINGEYHLPKAPDCAKDRERGLNHWLMDMGW